MLLSSFEPYPKTEEYLGKEPGDPLLQVKLNVGVGADEIADLFALLADLVKVADELLKFLVCGLTVMEEGCEGIGEDPYFGCWAVQALCHWVERWEIKYFCCPFCC